MKTIIFTLAMAVAMLSGAARADGAGCYVDACVNVEICAKK